MAHIEAQRRHAPRAVLLAVLSALMSMACAYAGTSSSATRSATSEPNPSRQSQFAPTRAGHEINEGESTMKIRITLDGDVLTATLADNAATRDLVSLLPLTLTLRDYRGTEKVSELPSRLSTAGTPAGVDPEIGDITYYAPWGNLAIFYRDFGFANGLVKLGHIDAGVEKLTRPGGDFNVRVELEAGSP